MQIVTYAEFGDLGEVEVLVNYDHQPYEAETREYPGCDEGAIITCVEMIVEGRKLDITSLVENTTTEECLADECLEQLHSQKEAMEESRRNAA